MITSQFVQRINASLYFRYLREPREGDLLIPLFENVRGSKLPRPAKDIVLVSGFVYQFASYRYKFFIMHNFFHNAPTPAPNMLCNAPTHYKQHDT